MTKSLKKTVTQMYKTLCNMFCAVWAKPAECTGETNQGTSLQSLLGRDTKQEDSYRVWYFGFCHNQGNIPWWQNFALKNDPDHLKHVYAFTQIGGFVLFVEPERDKVEFVLKYPNEEFPIMSSEDIAQELANKGHVIVRHVYKPGISSKKSIWNWIPSCVTVVKCATGYASFARTPKQLLHCLIRDGAHVFLKGELNGVYET